MATAASDLLAPAATHVSAALAGGLGAIVLAERSHLRDLTRRSLFVRWRTWAITAPVFGFAVMASRWTTLAFVAAVGAKAMHEYARMTRLGARWAAAAWSAGVLASVAAIESPVAWLAMPVVVALAASAVLVVHADVTGLRRAGLALAGFTWIGWLLGSLVVIREHTAAGAGALLAIGTAVAASDVCAFTLGRLLGGRKLAPALSPNKTVAGAAGNVVGAIGGFALMSFALPIGWLATGLLGVVVGVACVWGDLLESLCKRACGVKDAGSWLPGFGGMLDRIDSMLIAFPLAMAVLWVIA